MSNEAIEAKKKRILAAANSIGFVVRHISMEGQKTIITFKKREPSGKNGVSGSLPVKL